MHYLSEALLNYKDEKFKIFQKKLIPDTNLEIIGVKLPVIKELAGQAVKDGSADSFLAENHTYYEEYLLHGIILGKLKTDIFSLLELVDKFLPYLDNWAICDSTAAGLKIFKKHADAVLTKTKLWLKSNQPYTVRFAVVTLIDYFSDENYSEEILNLVSNLEFKDYYINMAAAWFFSVALVKQYDSAVKLIERKELPPFVHNKSIQKAIESLRITDERKSYLKSLKI